MVINKIVFTGMPLSTSRKPNYSKKHNLFVSFPGYGVLRILIPVNQPRIFAHKFFLSEKVKLVLLQLSLSLSILLLLL